ncbi:hypothetical protein B0H19DRAFT_1250807 [Mycena capillaripes]|nr:hypothetical protein B0H19DRAFT_1250807 [Mycena capillaripes]
MVAVPGPGLTKVSVASKVLGDKNLPLGNEVQAHNIRAFLAQFEACNTANDIAHNLLDFHFPDSMIYQNWQVDVKRVRCIQRACFDANAFTGTLCYIVHETDDPGPLYIALESATTVLEVIRRQWGPTVDEVAHRLLSRGIAFHLCVVSDSLDLIRPPRHSVFSGLGYRPQDYTPDQWDYRSYLAARLRLLRTPRGRVALRSGGVLSSRGLNDVRPMF